MLLDMGGDDRILLITARPRVAKSIDSLHVLPLLEDIDSVGIDRVCGEVEIDTSLRTPSGFDDRETVREIRVSLLSANLEPSGHNDHGNKRNIAQSSDPSCQRDRVCRQRLHFPTVAWGEEGPSPSL